VSDGDMTFADLALFADTTANAFNGGGATDLNAVGLILGNGWRPGFNLGEYFPTNFGEDQDTDDEFFHIAFDYDSVTGKISGRATRVLTGQSALLPSGLALTPGKTFSNDDTGDRFLIASGTISSSQTYFDNLLFEAVPEPTPAILLSAVGLVVVGGSRGRRTVISN
jgi:hypothetical protein